MRSVQHLIEAKGSEVISIAPDAPVIEAIRLMDERHVGAVVVMDGERLAGISSERDYARKIVLQGRSSAITPVSAIMTRRVLLIHPQQTLEECMALMTGKNLRHLPVLDNGRLVGVVSMRDVVKDLIAENEFMIEQLENYITDRR